MIRKYLFRQLRRQTRSIYTGNRAKFSETKEFLQKFKSGSVDLVKKDNGIAQIILNNPDRRNALSGSMMVEFMEKVEELEAWSEGVGLILRGADNASKAFCSGGDLKTVSQISNPDAGFMMSMWMNEATDRLGRLPLISATFLQGLAVGGGAEITTSTDFRLVSEKSSIAFVQARMGVAPGWGGARRLVSLVGKQNALDIMLSCRKITADEGMRLGLYDKILHEGATEQDAERWILDKIGETDPGVVRSLKMMVNNYDAETESRIFAPLWGGHAKSMH